MNGEEIIWEDGEWQLPLNLLAEYQDPRQTFQGKYKRCGKYLDFPMLWSLFKDTRLSWTEIPDSESNQSDQSSPSSGLEYFNVSLGRCCCYQVYHKTTLMLAGRHIYLLLLTPFSKKPESVDLYQVTCSYESHFPRRTLKSWEITEEHIYVQEIWGIPFYVVPLVPGGQSWEEIQKYYSQRSQRNKKSQSFTPRGIKNFYDSLKITIHSSGMEIYDDWCLISVGG